MLSEIVAGITTKLDEVFGDGWDIFVQPPEQEMGDRCFFVNVLRPAQAPMVGRRKHRTYPFNISYVSQHGLADLFDVLDRLTDAMEWITLADGSTMHGTGISGEVVDEALQFFVSYNTFVYTAGNEDSEKMEHMRIEMKG